MSQTTPKSNGHKTVAIVGAGPAGLMAGTVLPDAGFVVTVYDQAVQTGRKLFIAGASGLNVSTSLEGAELLLRYSGPKGHWQTCLSEFSVKDWLDFIAKLGLEWFQGTSARYFVRPMNAAPLVRAWRAYLQERRVALVGSEEMVDFSQDDSGVSLKFRSGLSAKFDAVCLALGGGSYLESGERLGARNVRSTKITAQILPPSSRVHALLQARSESSEHIPRGSRCGRSAGSRLRQKRVRGIPPLWNPGERIPPPKVFVLSRRKNCGV